MYDFDSGDLCLDFANTVNWHSSEHPIDELANYTAFVIWGEQAGLISPEGGEKLRRWAAKEPEAAAREYNYAGQMREAIYRVFSNRYAGRQIDEQDLDLINSLACEASAHRN